LLYCFCFTACLFVFLRLHFMVRCPSAGAATIYASSYALMKQNTHSPFFREEVDRPISVQV